MVREANKLSAVKVAKLKTPGRFAMGLVFGCKSLSSALRLGCSATPGMAGPVIWVSVPYILSLSRRSFAWLDEQNSENTKREQVVQ